MPRGRSAANLLRVQDEAEGETNQHQYDGTEKRWYEAANVKPGNKSAGQKQDDGVDHQEKQSQRQDAEREGQQLQKKSHGRVQKSDNQRRDQRAAEPGELKARNDVSADEQRNGTEQPNKK